MCDYIKRRKEMYQVALENRKFELTICWTRLAFFTAILYMLFKAISDPCIEENDRKILSYIGCVVSVSLGLTCYALKFWSENWEKKVDLLEEDLSYYIEDDTLTRATFTKSLRRYFHPSLTWHQYILAICSFCFFAHKADNNIFENLLNAPCLCVAVWILVIFAILEIIHFVRCYCERRD